MRLHTDNGYIHAGRKGREAMHLSRVPALLIARGRHPIIARCLAWGGWAAALEISREDARQAGVEIGLFS